MNIPGLYPSTLAKDANDEPYKRISSASRTSKARSKYRGNSPIIGFHGRRRNRLGPNVVRLPPYELDSPSVGVKNVSSESPGFDNYQRLAKTEFETHRVLETLWGKVNYQNAGSSVVTFESQTTGKCFDAKCNSAMLHSAGIGEGDYFKCVVVEEGATTRLSYIKSAPKTLTEDGLKSVLEMAGSFFPDKFV